LLSLLLMFNQLLWIREIRPRSKRNKIHTIEFWISQKDTSRTIFNNLRRWLLWIYDYLIIIITLQDRTRTVCDSLHVGRHSLRGIDG
jgi:hypothetical protein